MEKILPGLKGDPTIGKARIPIVTGTVTIVTAKKGEARLRRVTLLAELTFFFSCKLFAKFCRKM